MRFNVADLIKAPTGAARVYDVDDPLDRPLPEAALVGSITGEVRLLRDHAGILVTGRLSAQVRMACARCLAEALVPLDIELIEHFRPTVFIPGTAPVLVDPDEEDEPATRIDQKHILDLSEVVRQLLESTLPLHPLCSANCAGLCPDCGGDRNKQACDCVSEPDPRWDALRALLEEDRAGQ